jgi:23S rRNA pseudouridine1911/1915/1917 synthase
MSEEDLKKEFFVPEDQEPGERLDIFLMKKLPDYSRTYFQKLITKNFVKVNGKVVTKGFKVKPGDKIEITFPEEQPLSVEPQEVDFGVIDQQKDFLIIDKPAGLTVHHTKKEGKEPTLVSGLLYRFKEFEKFGEPEGPFEHDRPGIVHRIDKNTSGLLIVARNLGAQAELSELFKKRLVNKTYLAVIKGHPDLEGKIELPVGRHPTIRTKMSHASYAGKPALTYYKVLQYYKKGQNNPDCALVSINIVTGRTHQIRVHFAAIGHGLFGDEVYGSQSKLIKRQALHSWKLSFEFHGKKYAYSTPVPDDFRQLLSRLKDFCIKI